MLTHDPKPVEVCGRKLTPKERRKLVKHAYTHTVGENRKRTRASRKFRSRRRVGTPNMDQNGQHLWTYGKSPGMKKLSEGRLHPPAPSMHRIAYESSTDRERIRWNNG